MAWNLNERHSEGEHHPSGLHIPVANSLVHELRSYSAIDTTADGANNATLRPADFSNAGNLLPDKLFLGRTIIGPIHKRQKRESTDHSPVGGALADIENESSDNFPAPDGMGNFGVELNTVDGLAVVGKGRIGCRVGVSDDVKICWGF